MTMVPHRLLRRLTQRVKIMFCCAIKYVLGANTRKEAWVTASALIGVFFLALCLIRALTAPVLTRQTLDRKAWAEVPFLNNISFPRVLNQTHQNVLLDHLEVTTSILDKAGVQYALDAGTLLGSVLAHCLLPWDDDLDLAIMPDDVVVLEQLNSTGVLEKAGLTIMLRKCKKGVEKYDYKLSEINLCDEPLIRIFPKSRHWTVRDTVWSWPFVDLSPTLSYSPAGYRPLCGLWLPSPRQPWLHLSQQYGGSTDPRFRCRSRFRGHVVLNLELSSPITVPCASLAHSYPFVRRHQLLDEDIMETLWLGGKAAYAVKLHEDFVTDLEAEKEPLWISQT